MEQNSRFNNVYTLNDKRLLNGLLFVICFSLCSLVVNHLTGSRMVNEVNSRFLSEMINSNKTINNSDNSSSKGNNNNRLLENDIYVLFLRDLGGKVFEGTYELKNDYELLDSKSGKIRISLSLSNHQSYSIFTIDYSILNGNYKEKWLTIVQEFNINQYSKSSELKSMLKEKQITLTGLIEKNAKITSKNLFKNVNKTNSLVNDFNINISMPYFNGITGNLSIEQSGLYLDYKVNIKQNDSSNFERKLDNLGFVLTTIAFINLYYTIVTIRDCLIQKINPKSFSPYLIVADMVWNADLSLCCLYLAITQKSKFVDFLVSAFIFSVNFLIFEMRLLYLSYKSQDEFNNPQFRDEELQKKKILRFYSVLYGIILVNLFYLYYIMLHSVLLFIVIIITFIPQIYHNANVSISKNQIPTNVITMFTINKMFIPLYIRLWPYNIIESKPNYVFSFWGIGTIVFEIFVLFLQAKYGGLFIVPRRCRKGYYNYYKSIDEIIKADIDFYKSTCAICLALLSSNDEVKQKNDSFNNESRPSNANSITNPNSINTTLSLPVQNVTNANEIMSSNHIALDSNNIHNNHEEKLVKKRKKCCYRITRQSQKEIMLTPCNHCFHAECLKQWCTHKNECPICRKILPSID